MEETTTTPAVDEGAQAQPDEQTQVAEQPQETTATESSNLPEPSQGDNSEWLKNKGIDPTDPQAVSKLADMYRNAERNMHQKTQEASQLEKTISGANQQQINEAAASGQHDAAEIALARVAALETQQQVTNFFMRNPEAKQHEESMAKLVTERPVLRQMVNSGALSVDDLYAMAVGSNADSIKAQGGQQALQQLANKQTASAVPGAATTSATTPKKADPIMELWAE
jgi:hypothetical protein